MVTVSQADFARAMKVSRKTVTKWKNEGKIVMVGDLVDDHSSRESLEKFTGAKGVIHHQKLLPSPFKGNKKNTKGNNLGNKQGNKPDKGNNSEQSDIPEPETVILSPLPTPGAPATPLDGLEDNAVDFDEMKAEEVAQLVLGTYGSKAKAELVKESYMAHMKRLQYDKEAGRVVEVEYVGRIVGQALARVRTRLLSIPAERAPAIHRMRGVTEVQNALHAAISEALEELSTEAIKRLEASSLSVIGA